MRSGASENINTIRKIRGRRFRSTEMVVGGLRWRQEGETSIELMHNTEQRLYGEIWTHTSINKVHDDEDAEDVSPTNETRCYRDTDMPGNKSCNI